MASTHGGRMRGTHLFLLLGICLWNDVSVAVGPEEPCPFGHVSGEAASGDVEARLAHFFAVRNQTEWLSNRASDGVTEAMVNEMLKWSPQARQRAIEAVEALAPKDFSLRLVVDLALYRPDTWDWYMDYLMRYPSGYELTDSLVPLISAMPPALRASLLGKIRDRYPSLSKSEVHPETGHRLPTPPKRAMDAFINLSFHPYEALTRAENPTQIRAAYERYLSRLREQVFEGSAFGEGGAEAVYATIRTIQDALKEAGPAPDGREPWIIGAGSLFNGRARLDRSDIDMVLSHEALEPKLEGLAARINQEALRGYPHSNLRPDVMAGSTEFNLAHSAQVNPVFFKITAREVKLVVFPIIAANSHKLFTGEIQATPREFSFLLPETSVEK